MCINVVSKTAARDKKLWTDLESWVDVHEPGVKISGKL